MGILQTVFELTNVEGVKVLTILGMKFKLKKKNKDDKKYILEPIYCNFVNRFCKVKKNKIVFINFMNWQFADNPKYLAEEFLIRDIKNLDLVWFTNKNTDLSLIPQNLRTVK